MQRGVLSDVDLESVVAAVGATSYAKGAQYVRRRAVVSMAWDAARSTLHGSRGGGTPVGLGRGRPRDGRGWWGGGRAVEVMARLGPAGKSGGCIGGSLTWPQLGSLPYCGASPAAHVRLLQEMYAVYRASAGQG